MSLRSSTLIVPPIPPLNRGKVADWTTEHNFRSQLHKIVVQTFPHFLRGRSGISRLDLGVRISVASAGGESCVHCVIDIIQRTSNRWNVTRMPSQRQCPPTRKQ